MRASSPRAFALRYNEIMIRECYVLRTLALPAKNIRIPHIFCENGYILMFLAGLKGSLPHASKLASCFCL